MNIQDSKVMAHGLAHTNKKGMPESIPFLFIKPLTYDFGVSAFSAGAA
jgi:hypothetical protein